MLPYCTERLKFANSNYLTFKHLWKLTNHKYPHTEVK